MSEIEQIQVVRRVGEPTRKDVSAASKPLDGFHALFALFALNRAQQTSRRGDASLSVFGTADAQVIGGVVAQELQSQRSIGAQARRTLRQGQQEQPGTWSARKALTEPGGRGHRVERAGTGHRGEGSPARADGLGRPDKGTGHGGQELHRQAAGSTVDRHGDQRAHQSAASNQPNAQGDGQHDSAQDSTSGSGAEGTGMVVQGGVGGGGSGSAGGAAAGVSGVSAVGSSGGAGLGQGQGSATGQAFAQGMGHGVGSGLAGTRQGGVFKAVHDGQTSSSMRGEEAKAFKSQVMLGLGAALRKGKGVVTLRLRPLSLGELKISLKVTGKSVSARIEATTEQARSLLEGHRESLQAALEARHLLVERIDIALERNTGHEQDAQRGNAEAFAQAGLGEPGTETRGGDRNNNSRAEGDHRGSTGPGGMIETTQRAVVDDEQGVVGVGVPGGVYRVADGAARMVLRVDALV